MTIFLMANWKMNGLQPDVERFCAELSAHYSRFSPDVHCVFFPPYPYLLLAHESLKHHNVATGAQDCGLHVRGAFTGDVSAPMIRHCGAKYVLIGHSERRLYHHENADTLAHKVLRAVKSELVPVFCFGESREVFEQGQQRVVCQQQLQEVFEHNLLQNVSIPHVIFAYEPVWAIGTGLTPVAQDVQVFLQDMQGFITDYLSPVKSFQFLYGGSVHEQNFGDFITQPLITGALVGGASLTMETFWPLIEIAQSVRGGKPSEDR